MKTNLMMLRKKAGYSNRDEFAEKIGVNVNTYRSWESGTVTMNAAQLWKCAEALECTPNEIIGWKNESVSIEEQELIRMFRASDTRGREVILEIAKYESERDK